MNSFRSRFNSLFSAVFAPNIRKGFENTILLLAGIGFLIHLGLIGLKSQGIVLFDALNAVLETQAASQAYLDSKID